MHQIYMTSQQFEYAGHSKGKCNLDSQTQDNLFVHYPSNPITVDNIKDRYFFQRWCWIFNTVIKVLYPENS